MPHGRRIGGIDIDDAEPDLTTDGQQTVGLTLADVMAHSLVIAQGKAAEVESEVIANRASLPPGPVGRDNASQDGPVLNARSRHPASGSNCNRRRSDTTSAPHPEPIARRSA